MKNDWLDVDNAADTVVSIDYGKYLEFVCTTALLKTTPAFENYGTLFEARMNESNLSGNKETEYKPLACMVLGKRRQRR